MLEAIWTSQEDGDSSVDACLRRSHAPDSDEDSLDILVEMGLVTLSERSVSFTEKGFQRAASIIRRHRLAERLLVDVLGMTADQAEEMACTFEHSVVPGVTNGICTMLGHPAECPHGKKIPRGDDCLQGAKVVESVLQPLSEVRCSKPVRVAYIRTSNPDRMHQLLSLGFSPGTMLVVHQRTPVLVVQLDQSEFALDHKVAGDVYVWLDPK